MELKLKQNAKDYNDELVIVKVNADGSLQRISDVMDAATSPDIKRMNYHRGDRAITPDGKMQRFSSAGFDFKGGLGYEPIDGGWDYVKRVEEGTGNFNRKDETNNASCLYSILASLKIHMVDKVVLYLDPKMKLK